MLAAIVAFHVPEMAQEFFRTIELLGFEECGNFREDTALSKVFRTPVERRGGGVQPLLVRVVYPMVYPTQDDDRALNIHLAHVVSSNPDIHPVALEPFPNHLRVMVLRSMAELAQEVCAATRILSRLPEPEPAPIRVQPQPQPPIYEEPPVFLNEERPMGEFRPRLMLLLASHLAFVTLVSRIFPGHRNLIETASRDNACTMYRVRVDPGITSDDYIWCACPFQVDNTEDARARVFRWVTRNPDESFGIILDDTIRGETLEGSLLKCRTLSSVEMQVKRLLRMIPPPADIRERGLSFLERAAEAFAQLGFIPQEQPQPQPQPQQQRPDEDDAPVVDLSGYDPDDRVAIEAILEQNRREGLDVIHGQFQRPVYLLREDIDVDADGPQRLRERAFDARLVQDDAIRRAYDARRLNPAPVQEARVQQPGPSRLVVQDRPVYNIVRQNPVRVIPEVPPPPPPPPARNGGDAALEGRVVGRRPPPPVERVHYYIGGEEPVRLEPAPMPVLPRPQSQQPEGEGDIEIVGQGVHRDIGDDAMQGRVVGRQHNNQLRDRIQARANARAAQQIVNADPAVKKMVAPRMEKSDDVDAVAMTAEDNTCTVCLQSHITTMLFPCLHFVYCAGCIGVWKAGGNDGCPICRTKIEMVLQPRGKVSIEELRARTATPPSPPVAVAMAEPPVVTEQKVRELPVIPPPVPVSAPAPAPAPSAVEPTPRPTKRAKKESAPRRPKSTPAASKRKPKKK